MSWFGWQILKEIFKRWSHVLTRVLAYVLICVLIRPCTYSRASPCTYSYFLVRTHLMLNHLLFFLQIIHSSLLILTDIKSIDHSRNSREIFSSVFICNFLYAVLRLRKGTYGRCLFSHSRVSINYVPGIYWLHASHSLVIYQVPISYISGIRWLFVSYFKRHFQIIFLRNFSWILPVQFIYNFLCVVFRLRKGTYGRHLWRLAVFKKIKKNPQAKRSRVLFLFSCFR